MRKRILKIVVAFVTTISICFTFITSKASIVNDNFVSYIEYYYEFKNYSDINSIDDLYGTIWQVSFDGYYTFERGSDWSLIADYDFSSIEDARLIPFFLQARTLYGVEQYGYEYNPTAPLSLMPFVENNGLKCSITDEGAFLHARLYNIYQDDNNNVAMNYPNNVGIFAYNKYDMICYTLDIGFTFYVEQPQIIPGSTQIYLVFPNSGEYTLILEDMDEEEFISNFKRDNTLVTPSSLDFSTNNRDKTNSYANGYDAGLNAGSSGDDYRFSFLTGVFNAVSDVLSIEIFPNVSLGYFIFVPLVFGITGVLFWFWRKD